MSLDRSPATGNDSTSSAKGQILQFRRRLRVSRKGDQPIADPLQHLEEEEDRRRMQQNLAAAAIILLIIVSGYWLIDHLRTSARIAACVEAGHRNCVPLDLDDKGR